MISPSPSIPASIHGERNRVDGLAQSIEPFLFSGVDIDRVHFVRRAAKIDGNQGKIVDGLRAFGASVHIGSAIGQGFPDVIVGYGGRTYLFEIKDPAKPKSKRKLTDDQVRFRDSWKGHYAVIETVEQAIEELQRI